MGTTGAGHRATANISVITAIEDASQTTGLELCLDAGDIASWPGSGESWLDLSGNGYDFFLGTGTGGDARDPTFNGTPGALSSAEYWSSDGGDLFTYDTTNETWMQNLHKDNAAYSFLWVVYPVAGINNWAFGDSANSNANVGLATNVSNASNATNNISNGSGTAYARQAGQSGYGAAGAEWQRVSTYLDEAGNLAAWARNDTLFSNVSGSYSSPSAADATYTFQIGSPGNSVAQIPSGARYAVLCVWSTVLGQTNLKSVWNGIRGRWGL